MDASITTRMKLYFTGGGGLSCLAADFRMEGDFFGGLDFGFFLTLLAGKVWFGVAERSEMIWLMLGSAASVRGLPEAPSALFVITVASGRLTISVFSFILVVVVRGGRSGRGGGG